MATKPGTIVWNPAWVLTPKRRAALARLAELGADVTSRDDAPFYVTPRAGMRPPDYIEIGYVAAQLEDVQTCDVKIPLHLRLLNHLKPPSQDTSHPGKITWNPKWHLTPERKDAIENLAEQGIEISSSPDTGNYLLMIPHDLAPQVYVQIGGWMARLGDEDFPDGCTQLTYGYDGPAEISKAYPPITGPYCPPVEFAESYPHAMKIRIYPRADWQRRNALLQKSGL